MKRKILILALVLLALLAGCDHRQQVGICFRDCDDPFTAQYRQELERALTDNGYAVTVMDAGNDQSKQDTQVAELIKKNTDVLILEPVMTSALDTVAEQAQKGKVPVVFVNRQPEEKTLDSWEKLCFVGYDTAQPGQLQAQLLSGEADINGDGCVSYAILAGPEDHLDAILRSDGCTEMLEQMNMLTQALAVSNGAFTREEGQRRCAMLLSQYGKDIEVLFCNSDELAFGAIEAIKDGGRTVGKDIFLYGIDGQRQALLFIRSGDLTGTVSVDIPGQVQQVLDAVKTYLMGGTAKKVNYTDHIAIDQTNVEDYIAN